MDRGHGNPFRGLVDSISEWNRSWGRGGLAPKPDTRLGVGPTRLPGSRPPTYSPKAENLVIRVSLSGVYPVNVEITLTGDVLTVSGEQSDSFAGAMPPRF